MEFLMTNFDITGDVPVPAEPERKKRGRPFKDKGDCPPKQEATKSHLKLVEELKEAAAPAPDPLNRDPATGPDPYDLQSAVYDQTYLDDAAVEDIDRPLK